MATHSTSGIDRDLPLVEPVGNGACCAACALPPAPPEPSLAPRLEVTSGPSAVGGLRARRPTIARDTDRRITLAGLLLAAGFLGLAGLAAGMASGRTIWLPLHLALAGAAGTAIATVLPFFTTALGRVGPARPLLRVATIGLVAGGAGLAAIGLNAGSTTVASAGGGWYLAGLVGVSAAAFLPLRRSLGFGFRLVHAAYAVALGQVAVGVSLATASLAGWAVVADAWMWLKPAHAWLNIFGFVTLVIAASLVHLAPTVAGGRIRPGRTAAVALACLSAGPPLVALGYAASWGPVGWVGALLEVAGAIALVVHGARVQLDRGTWTTDPGWHRFANLGILASPVWLLVAIVIASGRILSVGTSPGSWSVELIAVPLLAGGMAQVLIASWTHLVPAIGPGDAAARASQRRWLGRGAVSRWGAWNAGVAIATIGVLTGDRVLLIVGGMLLGMALLAAIGLLALAVGLSSWRSRALAVAARP